VAIETGTLVKGRTTGTKSEVLWKRKVGIGAKRGVMMPPELFMTTYVPTPVAHASPELSPQHICLGLSIAVLDGMPYCRSHTC